MSTSQKFEPLQFKTNPVVLRTSNSQGGQSHGLPDGVQGLYEPVIRQIIKRKIVHNFCFTKSNSCGKVQKNSYFSAQDYVKVSPGFAAVFLNTSNN